MRIKVISCEIFFREMCAVAARSPHRVELEFLPKGLHDIGCDKMRGRLQEAIDRCEPDYEAIVLGYGLCNNGILGLEARGCPLVIPRAHDCITLFLGDRRKYLEYFERHPGTYFKTTGWIERGDGLSGELRAQAIQHRTGMDRSYADLVQQYGEENAKYLVEQLGDITRYYSRLVFIEMGVEPDTRFERETQDEAARKGWEYEKLQGDLAFMQRLVEGNWNEEEVLVVPPGRRVGAEYNSMIIQCERVEP